MLKAFLTLWLAGTGEMPWELRRQIAMTNQIGLFAVVIAAPYQVLMLSQDASLYLPLVAVNLTFIAFYFSILAINRCGFYDAASVLVLIAVAVQLFINTYFVGTGSGVHLFFLAFGSAIPLIFYPRGGLLLIVSPVSAALLFAYCHFMFPPDSAVMNVPENILHAMYVGSGFGVLLQTGVFAYFFRVEIARAERSLTETNRELERLSATDQLTALANRRGLDAFLQQAWAGMQRDRRPLSVLMCDVDFFKAYNDLYGHQAGDQCLRLIAAILRETVRRPLDLVARYGGEEFAVVLPDTGADGILRVGEQIREAVERLGIPHASSEVASAVTISIGGAVADPETGSSMEQLVAGADEALYEAKLRGRNRIVLQPTGFRDGCP